MRNEYIESAVDSGSSDRRSFLKLTGAGAATALAGCLGSDDDSEDEVDVGDAEIEYWTLFGGGDGAAMEDITSKINDSNDFTVNRQRVPWAEYYDRLFTSLTADEAPDVAIIHTEHLVEYEDLLMDLSDDIGTDPYIDSVAEMSTLNGAQLGAPLDTHPYGLYYNKDVFEDAGLDPESPPESPDEFVEAANAIRDNTDHWAFHNHAGFWMAAVFNAFVQSKGDQLLTDDNEPAFHTEGGLEAVQFLNSFYNDRGWAPSDSDTGWEAWQRGEVGMSLEGSWHVGVLDEVDWEWGMTKPNILPNVDQQMTWANSHLVMVPRKERTEAEEAAAIEFARQLTQDYNEEWGIQAGHLPAATEAVESDALQESERWDQTLEVYAEMAESDQLAYFPPTENNGAFHEAMYIELDDMRFGNQSPQEALDNAEEGVGLVFD